MPYTTLIAAADLARHLDNPEWAIIDCRFALHDTEQGQRDYLQAHIPGALYAHLDRDLSAPMVPGQTGRHPLPSIEECARLFSVWGINRDVQVVAYDDTGGALGSARLWWMLRWLGHNAVAVLDGGWQAWQQAGLPTRSGQEDRPARSFVPLPREDLLIDSAEVQARQYAPDFRLIDVRAAERYRGAIEPLDPVAGHIPGAVSLPFAENLNAEGRFRTPEELRARYQPVLGNVPAEQTAFYCGSGVSAAQGLLALAHAGLGEGRLYAGSWSEWITDPQRPVETEE